ncbi:MAG: hypothetical protein QXK49_01805 [Candidatus Aenigmatarchaeota archaeon]
MKYILALIIALIALALTLNFNSPVTSTTQSIKYTGVACIYKNSELVTCKHNIITNKGKDLIKTDMMGTGAVTLDQLAVANSTSAQSASDTDLQGEWTTCGLARATGALTSIGTGNWSINYQWTSTCDNVYVNATGIYNTTASGNLFAETTWSPTTTLMNGDKLNVTYYTWVS